MGKPARKLPFPLFRTEGHCNTAIYRKDRKFKEFHTFVNKKLFLTHDLHKALQIKLDT